MEIEETARILRALADGANPKTGKRLPENNPIHLPEVTVALADALDMVETIRDIIRGRVTIPLEVSDVSQHGAPWLPKADQELVALYESGLGVAALATHFRRSAGAIRSRLKRIGIVGSHPNQYRPSSSGIKDNRGAKWTHDLETELLREYEIGRSLTEISMATGRSLPGVIAKLIQLGKKPESRIDGTGGGGGK